MDEIIEENVAKQTAYLVGYDDGKEEGIKEGIKEGILETQKEVIEIAPLAYMRGRTLENACVILDEAQNTTTKQMKMFLTRLGFRTKMIITGDVSQTDLPRGVKSGLVEVVNMLKDIEEIGVTEFSKEDVVRHPLVSKIIHAYESHENSN